MSVHILISELTTIFCPRNVQTPESAVACLKCDSGIANILRPGAKRAGGAAWPVTE